MLVIVKGARRRSTFPRSRIGTSRPFFFSDGSLAAHYISFHDEVVCSQANENNSNNNPQIQMYMPLSVAAIGSGWFDPINQFNVHNL